MPPGVRFSYIRTPGETSEPLPDPEHIKGTLSQLEKVRDRIREAEVELREATYYPPPETRRHLSEVTSNLAAADKALRAVLRLLEPPD